MNVFERVLRTRVMEEQLQRYGIKGRIGTVIITPRFVTSRHVVAMIYPERETHPRLVVKCPRRPGDNSGVRREAETLQRVTAAGLAPSSSVPEVLGLFDERGYTFLVETALRGVPLDPARVKQKFSSAVQAGVDFVSELSDLAFGEADQEWFERAIERPLVCFAEKLPREVGARSLVDRTICLLEPLRRATLPLVCQHGDLSHPNILQAPVGHLQVLDWERSSFDGLLGLDLVFYLQYLAESCDDAYARVEQIDVFDKTFGAPDAWGRTILATQLAAHGIDASLAPQLILAAWARSSASMIDRLLPQEETGSDAAPFRQPSSEQLTAAIGLDRDVALWRHALRQIGQSEPREGRSGPGRTSHTTGVMPL